MAAGDDAVYGTADDVIGDNSGEGHDAWRVTDGLWWVLDAGADGVEATADDVIGGISTGPPTAPSSRPGT